MSFIYILYFLVIVLVFIVIYMIIDYRFARRHLMEKPKKLKLELDEKIKNYELQKLRFSNFYEIQQEMDKRVLQIDLYLAHLKKVNTENKFDLHTIQIMELNTRFTIEQINKSLKIIKEMKSQEN